MFFLLVVVTFPTGCATRRNSSGIELENTLHDAPVFDIGRGITDLWLEKGKSVKVVCEGTSAKCATRCAFPWDQSLP
jgi:hypothetical protein